MTPDTTLTPIKQALIVLFDHPELLTLDPVQAGKVQQLIVNQQRDPHFADVWQYISAHPLDGDDPWAAELPITLADGKPATDQDGNTLYQWNLSPGMCGVIQQPLATVLPLVRAMRAAAPVVAATPVEGATWTLTQLPPRFGVRIPALSFYASASTYTIQAQNTYLRHLAVYVEFFTGGQPTPPPGWTSRLPAAAQGFLESATVKYLGVLPPTISVAGMAVPAGATSLSFALPGPAYGARLLFGGPGFGNLQLLVDAAATLLTAVLDYAVPVILDGAAVGLSKSAWFSGVLADATIQAEVLAASQFLFTGPPPADSATLLQTLSVNMGALLLGDALPTLQASIAKNIGATVIANAVPVLGWAETELAAQASQPLQAQLSSMTLSSPATFTLDLAPLAGTLLPDPRHGMWPDLAVTYQATVTYAGASLAQASGPIPAVANTPIAIAIPGLPAGGQVAVTTSVQSANGSSYGEAQTPAAFVPPADQAPLALTLLLDERTVSLTSATQYQHKQKLSYDPAAKAHVWQVSAAPTTVGLVPAPGAAFRDLVSITLQEASGDVGYAWQEGGQAAQYAMQNIGVIAPEARLKFSGMVFAQPPFLAYDRSGAVAAAAAGAGWNVYLDPTTYAADKLYHLRGVALDGQTPFNLSQTTSWGAFYSQPARLTIHPAGRAIACLQTQDAVQIVTLPGAAAPLAQAPLATVIVGPGAGIGMVSGPVAVAATAVGYFLVLEQDNARLQAFDAYGNSVPYFAGSSPVLALDSGPGLVQYLDLAIGLNDALYVLSYQGSNPQAADYRLDLYQADGTLLSRTTGVAAARLVADSWGRVYTLNYEALQGPGGRIEPSISQWIPSSG
ncbi:MAG: hypothetical protein ACTHNK_10695 [Thermomicrobiales bacterium]